MSIARAPRLRQAANAPEAKAWAALRVLRRYGWAVRRQHPIGRDIVDFAVLKARLVIEIDGGVHALSDVAARDAFRDARLTAEGWRVLRIDARRAMDPDALLFDVQQVLGLLQPLSREGEGQG